MLENNIYLALFKNITLFHLFSIFGEGKYTAKHLEMTDSCSLSIGSGQFFVSSGVGVSFQN